MLYFLPHCVCRAWSQDSGGLALSMTILRPSLPPATWLQPAPFCSRICKCVPNSKIYAHLSFLEFPPPRYTAAHAVSPDLYPNVSFPGRSCLMPPSTLCVLFSDAMTSVFIL